MDLIPFSATPTKDSNCMYSTFLQQLGHECYLTIATSYICFKDLQKASSPVSGLKP